MRWLKTTGRRALPCAPKNEEADFLAPEGLLPSSASCFIRSSDADSLATGADPALPASLHCMSELGCETSSAEPSLSMSHTHKGDERKLGTGIGGQLPHALLGRGELCRLSRWGALRCAWVWLMLVGLASRLVCCLFARSRRLGCSRSICTRLGWTGRSRRREKLC